MSAAWTYIYGLVDPRTNRIRYIGKADNPQRRLTNHLADARRGVVSVRCRWLRKLMKLGLVPTVEILEEVPVDRWDEAERWWIARLSLSHDLTNGTHGGDGGGMVAGSDAARRHGDAIRGRALPATAGERRRETWARKMADPEWGPAYSARLSHIRRSMGSRPPTHVGVHNPAAKLTPARVVEARERHAAGETTKSLAAAFGMSEASMLAALCGDTWKSAGGPLHRRRDRLDPETRSAVVALLSRMSNSQIAKKFGLPPLYVGDVRRKEKLKTLRMKEMD